MTFTFTFPRTSSKVDIFLQKLISVLLSFFLNFSFDHLIWHSAFEGMFKFCRSFLHGTRGYVNQIGQHLVAENYLIITLKTNFLQLLICI